MITKQNEIDIMVDTLEHIQKFSGSTILIKLGGSILHEHALIKSLCKDLSLLRAANIKVVLVHGGSKAINEVLNKYAVKSEFKDGLRVTSKQAMDLIEMVLCGHINQVLVRELNSLGISCAGLSGADNNMLSCDYYSQEHGFVGKVKKVNTDLVEELLESQNRGFGMIPVIAPIGVDDQGNAMNINADWAASCIAAELGIDKLIYITDQDGIKDLQGKVISELSQGDLNNLVAQNIVTDGMLTKTKTILSALESGIKQIHIINGIQRHSVLIELFTNHGIGSVCIQGEKQLLKVVEVEDAIAN